MRPEVYTLVVGTAGGNAPKRIHNYRESSPVNLPDEVEKARAVDGQTGTVDQVEKTDSTSPEVPNNFLALLKLYSGTRLTDEKFWKVACRPLALCRSPLVVWAALVIGTDEAWRTLFVCLLSCVDNESSSSVTVPTVTVSLIFSEPQFGYGFSAGIVGLISGVGPLIGALLGNAVAGPLSDWTVRWMSRKNGGIYEPELVFAGALICVRFSLNSLIPYRFRLLMMMPLFIISTIGWFGWAISAHLRQRWIVPAIFYSLISFGHAINHIMWVFPYLMLQGLTH